MTLIRGRETHDTALDTNVIIYSLEFNSFYTPKARNRLDIAAKRGESLMTSEISRMECEVYPYKLNDSQLLANYESFLLTMTVLPISNAISRRAARIRAQHRFKSLDALHLAAAVAFGATRFLTNDHRLDAFTDLVVEVLS